MQRPVMDPTFVDDAQHSAARLRKPRFRQMWKLARKLGSILLTDLMPRIVRKRLKVEEGTPLGRFVRGVMYRLAFMPILLSLVIAALVMTGTHPPAVSVETDPATDAIYYEPVNFQADDGTRSEAWLVPVLDARRVIELKERALHVKHPAVILAHDYGASKQQMLPLVRPLHDAGMVVLVVGLRGSGTATPAAQTFGLTEVGDVKAAADMLRRRAYIDPDRIGVVGIGTGATAALLAAQRDESLSVLVLDDPPRGAEDVIAQHIAPHPECLRWMLPMCKWAFEIAFGVDAEDVEISRFQKLMSTHPVLMLDHRGAGTGVLGPHQIAQVEAFLRKHLMKNGPAMADTSGELRP